MNSSAPAPILLVDGPLQGRRVDADDLWPFLLIEDSRTLHSFVYEQDGRGLDCSGPQSGLWWKTEVYFYSPEKTGFIAADPLGAALRFGPVLGVAGACD